MPKKTKETRKLLLAKKHDCICCAQLARVWGVHTASVTRQLAIFAETIGIDKEQLRLGYEFLFTPYGLEEFEDWLIEESNIQSPFRKAVAKNQGNILK